MSWSTGHDPADPGYLLKLLDITRLRASFSVVSDAFGGLQFTSSEVACIWGL